MDLNRNRLATTLAPDGTLVVAGDIDMAGCPALDDAMAAKDAELVSAGGGDLVVDVAGVQFIDSSGLRSLLAAARRAAARQAHLVLRSAGPEIIRLFEITGTAGEFTIASRRE